MRKLVCTALAAAALAAAPAPAALIVDDTTLAGVTLDFGGNLGPSAEKIKNNNAPDGTTITLKSDGGYLVDYIGSGLGLNGVLQASGNGDGFAKVVGSNGYIDALKIDPQGAQGFGAIDFNIGVFNTTGSSSHYEGDITLSLKGGGSVVFNAVLFAQNQNKFSVTANPGIVFESILFSNVYHHGSATKKKAAFYIGDEFESMRQVSMAFEPASPVPEPAAWAMMIAGFGVIGAALRSRRKLRPLAA